MKRFISIMLVICCLFSVCSLAACKKEDKGDNVLTVGMTVYKPMNYKDADGNWTGFDTEFAQKVAEKLGMEVEFVEIEWDSKWTLLSSGKIDCVWNGMTISEEAKANASVTDAYVLNAQVVVMKAENVDKYADITAMKDLEFAVEGGSTGHDIAVANNLKVTECADMSAALLEVSTGKKEACIIDITMANSMTGEGTDYANLSYKVSLEEEEYGIAFPKDSEMTAKVNEIMKEMKEDGTLKQLAEKYGVTLAK